MKKSILIAALALGLAGAAAAATDKAFTIEGIHDYELETSGIRLGATFAKPAASRTFTHEFNVNLGYMTNDNKAYNGTDLTCIPLTAGYHASTELTKKLSVFAGGNVGVMRLEQEPNAGDSIDTNAPLISIGGGLKFQLTENTHIRVAYEIGKIFVSDDKEWGVEKSGIRTLSLGVGIAF